MAKHASRTDSVLIERLGPLYWPLYIALLTITAVGTLYSGVAMAAGHDMHDHDHDHAGPAIVLQADGDCARTGKTITVNLGDNGFDKRDLSASLCDVLQVTNTSKEAEHVAIGPHEKHVIYPGYAEKTMQPGATTTIVLRTAGDFEVHDHYHDEHAAEITIRK